MSFNFHFNSLVFVYAFPFQYFFVAISNISPYVHRETIKSQVKHTLLLLWVHITLQEQVWIDQKSKECSLMYYLVHAPLSCWSVNWSIVFLFILLFTLGPVARMPVSANLGLNFNLGFFFLLSKAVSRIIFSILFRVSNHQIVGEEN